MAISSKRFAFERAEARLIPSDWDSPLNLARGDPAALYGPTHVVEDGVASIAVATPGESLLLLTQLTVRRFDDDRRFLVPLFATRVHLSDADIQKGTGKLSLNPTGVFRVSIIERGHQPLCGRQLTLHCDGMTARYVTDEHGAILLLGSSAPFSIHTETASISIEPL